MKREIVCGKCAAGLRPMHPEDVVNGFKMRSVEITAKKPSAHNLKIAEGGVTTVHELRSLLCDRCGDKIADGQPAFAVTTWNTNREGTPGDWEKDYSA